MKNRLIEILRSNMTVLQTAGHSASSTLRLVDILVRNGVVPVVLCRDCKYFEMNLFDGCEVCTHIHTYVMPDFGCIDGERKNNGQADKAR